MTFDPAEFKRLMEKARADGSITLKETKELQRQAPNLPPNKGEEPSKPKRIKAYWPDGSPRRSDETIEALELRILLHERHFVETTALGWHKQANYHRNMAARTKAKLEALTPPCART